MNDLTVERTRGAAREFRDAVAIVAGGASGLGRALVERLADAGAHVVIADLKSTVARAAASELRAQGGSVSVLDLDVTDGEAVYDAVRQVHRAHRRLDLLFNFAAVTVVGDVRDCPLSDWSRMIDVNFKGVVHGVHAAYPLMVDQGFGHIVNGASLAGLVPSPWLVAYGSTRAAVVGLSLALRAEASSLGVRVSVMCPGLVQGEGEDRGVDVVTRSRIDRALAGLPRQSVGECADACLRGVVANRAVITSPRGSGASWRIARLFPWSIQAAARRRVRKHREQEEG